MIGQKYKNRFNTDIPENKIIVEVIKHEALNCLVGTAQSPKEQLSVLYNERWKNVLSEETKSKILDLLSMDEKDFYIDKLS